MRIRLRAAWMPPGGSAANEIDTLIQTADVVEVAGQGHPVDDAGHQYDRCIDDIRRGGCGAQLSRRTAAGSVERVDHDTIG